MNLKWFNPMKIKIRYTKLPKQKLPSFQSNVNTGEVQTDEYGNVIGAPYLMGQAGMQSGANPMDASWEQAPAGAINPKSGVVNPSQGISVNTFGAQPFSLTGQNTSNWMWSNPLQSEAPALRINRVKTDGTIETTGQKGNPEYTVYEQANSTNVGGTFKPTDITPGTNSTAPNKRKGPFSAFDYLSMASTVVDYANQRKKFKEFDRNLRRQAFDITGAASPEFEGNYDTNTGMFQPYRIFKPNEGMTMAEQGGELNNTMKIRITKGPQENMAYGGQSNYGLDLGRKKVYTDMTDPRSESVSNTLTGVPRYMANIEAEGGETVYGDMDGDGGLEHMKISGPRHNQGGVPLNVPEGSFVFSDTAKMRIKDPQILKYFSLPVKSKGYTPAEIAKRYDINKYKAIIEDPNADELNKNTAQLMVKKYQDKLSQLALVQESMKGFPGGIPKVAQNQMPQEMPQAAYGGYLPTYQGTTGPSTVGPTAKKLTKAEIDAQIKAGKLKPVEGMPNRFYSENIERVDELAGKPGTGGSSLPGPKESTQLTNDPCAYVASLASKGYTKEELTGLSTMPSGKKGRFVHPGAWASVEDCYAKNYKPREGSTPGTDPTCPEGYEKDPENPGKCRKITKDFVEYNQVIGYKCLPDGSDSIEQVFNSPEERTAAGFEATKRENCSPGKLEVPKTNPGARFDFTTPDKLSMIASASFAPKAYFPWSPNLSFRPNRLALQDWQAQAQNLQQSARAAQETLGTYQPGQALASNFAFLQGQTANNIANTIAQTDAGNVDRFNNFELREGARKDFVNQFNQKNMTDLYDKGVATKEAFRQESINAADRFTKSYANAWNNRMNLGLLNKTNPIYNIDPRSGNSFFMNGYGPEYFSNVANRSAGFDWQDAKTKFAEAQKFFPGLNEETFLKYSYPGLRTIDKDGDNMPDSRSRVQYGKKGGQVNPLVAYLLGGFSYDPRDY
jgi:hypothetical protein